MSHCLKQNFIISWIRKTFFCLCLHKKTSNQYYAIGWLQRWLCVKEKEVTALFLPITTFLYGTFIQQNCLENNRKVAERALRILFKFLVLHQLQLFKKKKKKPHTLNKGGDSDY